MDYIPNICNRCGKTFDFWDNQENFNIDKYIGFGSRYDLNRIRLHLCCDCFDKLLDWLIPQCKYNPLSEYDITGELIEEDEG